MRRTPLLALLPLALALALTGCGEDKPSEKLGTLGDDTETSASPDPGSTSSDTTEPEATPFDDEGHEAIRGKIEATTPEEKAVAEAWLGYWTARGNSFAAAKVDPDLGTYAAVTAVSDVVQYVAYLKQKKLHTVGDSRYNVRNISIQGRSATLFSCAENKSIDRNADGTPAEPLKPFFSGKGTVVENGGVWRVVDAPSAYGPDCR